MKSQLLNLEKDSLLTRKKQIEAELVTVKAEHKKAEKKAQVASRFSMNLYYKEKELVDAIAKIEEAITILDSVEKERW